MRRKPLEKQQSWPVLYKSCELNKERIIIIISFLTIYIVWGSTYLFSAFVVQEMDAFRACAYRFIPAGIISFAMLYGFGARPKLIKGEIKNSVIAGFTFLGLGTGGAIWSLNHLDSGFSALIISAEPLIIVLLIWLYKRQAPAMQTLAGVFLGILGMYFLISQDEMVASYDQWMGILAIFFSMLAWGVGSIFVSGAKLPSNALLNTGIQLIIGGLACLVLSIVFGENDIYVSNFTVKGILSMLFLIFFGSIAAFNAFNYLLKKVSTEKVVTNTYINPIIAMFLGYLFNEEIITGQSMLAAVIMLFGVFLINSRRVGKT